MGQYHVVVNLDKKEYLWGGDLGCGVKLWDQLVNLPSTSTALIILLACSNGRGGGDLQDHIDEKVIGRWAGDRIAIVGDYAKPEDLPAEFKADLIYQKCRHTNPEYRNIFRLVIPIIERELGGKYTREGRLLYIHYSQKTDLV